MRPSSRTGRILLVVLGVSAVAGAAMLGYLTGLKIRSGSARASVPLEDVAGRGTEADAVVRIERESDWLEIPAPAAEFEGLDGGTVRLSDYRGGIVLLNFWGTWCPPCVKEIPELVKLQPQLEELGATVLGPAIDSGSSDNIRKFLADYDVNYPIVKARNEVAIGDFEAMGYPTTFLIDADGVIRKRYLGPQTADGLLADVRELIDGQGLGSGGDDRR